MGVATVLLVFMTFNLYAKDFIRTQRVIHRDIDYNRIWSKELGENKVGITSLVKILEKSKVGLEIVKAAREKTDDLYSIIKPGRVSLIDTSLLRNYSSEDILDVTYKNVSKITINRDLTVVDAVLDLAHELVHFIKRGPFNPYENNFSFKDFLISTIEGEGGEVDAYILECKIVLELFKNLKNLKNKCQFVFKDGVVNRKKLVKLFYRLGGYYKQFIDEIKRYNLSIDQFPHISSKEPYFISSAYGRPYPVATIYEYNSILYNSCINDSRRINIAKKYIKMENLTKLENSFNKRCRQYISSIDKN